MPISEICLLVGGVANCFIALSRLLTMQAFLKSSDPIPLGMKTTRGSLAIASLRETYIHTFFGLVTLVFSAELLTPRFGVIIGGGMGGYLAFKALEQFRLPEYPDKPVACTVGAAGYFLAYLI